MAKQYEFRFHAVPAEFKNGLMSLLLSDLAREGLGLEIKTLTFQEALKYLEEFSARIKKPHAAFLNMARRNDRVPPGFNKAERKVYFEG